MSETVYVDGSYGEGGGQIIRTSLSLAAMTGRVVEIASIRARRSRPGLQPQHLTAVRAAASLCNAKLNGDAVGSSFLRFAPQSPPQAGSYSFDIGTAGATPLVLQTTLLPLARTARPSRVTVRGGTHVPHAPTAEYLEAVYVPVLRQAGVPATFRYGSAGFFPRGGGEVEAAIEPWTSRQPLILEERGKLTSLRAYIVTAELPEHVGERGAAAVEKFMKAVGRRVTVERRDRPSRGPGAAVVLAAECEGGRAAFTALGERGKPIERVAEEACEQFMEWWKTGAACDEHLADQFVLPAVLARGESRWTTPVVTEHLRTVLWLAAHFLTFESSIEERPEAAALVTICAGGQA